MIDEKYNLVNDTDEYDFKEEINQNAQDDEEYLTVDCVTES